MAREGPWDVGHTEDSEEVEALDYIDDAGEGRYEELLSYAEQLARRGSVLDIKASFGRDPVLIGKIDNNRKESYIPVTKREGSEVEEEVDEAKGLTYNVILFKDGYYDPKHCAKDGKLKPRRPVPVAFASEFIDKLSFRNKKWVYEGELNDWPGLQNLEVVSMQFIYSNKLGVYAKQYWQNTGDKTKPPFFPEAGMLFFLKTPEAVRVQVRAPAWTEEGYSQDNPGFVYWYSAFAEGGPKLAHGENIIAAIRASERNGRQPKVTNASFFAHRYARKNNKESAKDRITYHTGLFLEWDHSKHGTVLELAFLNGLGGYAGRSNWLEDRDAKPMNNLFKSFPSEMVLPWKTDRAELRMIDVTAKNIDEFKAYMQEYTGTRFIEPEVVSSSAVRISFRDQEHLAKYLLNYSVRDTSYSEAFRNCQTFAADLMSFLAGKQKFEPYHPLNRIMYIERKHLFLYDPEMFEKQKSNMSSWAGMKEWFKENYGRATTSLQPAATREKKEEEFSIYDTLKSGIKRYFSKSQVAQESFTLEDSDDEDESKDKI